MKTKIVGILNLTPDSFSDGGLFDKVEPAILHLKKMLGEGVDIVDIGAESTRPGAIAISADEEWQRLEKILPLIILEVKKFNHENKKQIQISIDTRFYTTASRAYNLGVEIINDVSGLIDEKIIEFIAKNNVKTVFMHSLSVPANPDIIVNRDLNVVDEIIKWAQEKIIYLQKKGVKKSQLIFDPGIGFSKSATQSLRIVKNIVAFKILDLPLYVGHSKKSFLDTLNIENLSNDKESRAKKTLIISNYLAAKGVDFIRVHDVLENKKILENLNDVLVID